MQVGVIVLTVIVSILLIGIVLIQKSKGGGLSSQFGGAGAVVGVRQTNSFLEKGTWTLVAALVILSVISVWCAPKQTAAGPRTAPVSEAPAATNPAARQTAAPVQAIPVQAAPAAETAPAAEAPAAE